MVQRVSTVAFEASKPARWMCRFRSRRDCPPSPSSACPIDVVKHEIQQKNLFKSVLRGYDENSRPLYHVDDPLIDLAALVRSQQLASKNNLKHCFVAMKRRMDIRSISSTETTRRPPMEPPCLRLARWQHSNPMPTGC
jgi:hypothetical protein